MTGERRHFLLLLTSCLCLLHLINGEECLFPVPDLRALFGHTPGTKPKELTRVPAEDYKECMKQCCDHTEGLCNLLKYKPVPDDTEEVGEPNCVVLSCDPITDCFVTQGDGVQIFADSKAVLESLGKASTKSMSAIPTPTPNESSKEKETGEASGKTSSPRPTPQLSTLPGREDSMLGPGLSNANDTASLDKKKNNVSSNNTTPVPIPNLTGGQDGLTTTSNKGDTPEKAPSTGPGEAPSEETSASSKVLTAEGGSNAEHTAVYSENETSPPVNDKGERVASPADGRAMMSADGSTPVNSTETTEALGNSIKSTADAMSEALSAAPDNATTIFHQTLPSPISKSFPTTQYPHNASTQHPTDANTASNATTPTISASRTAHNLNAPPSKNTASDATTRSARLNDSTPAFPHNSLTTGPQSHQSSPAPLPAEGGPHSTTALPVDQYAHSNVLPIVTESSTSEADGQTNTSSAGGDVDINGSGGWTPAHNDSVGLAAGSRLKGNKTDTSSESDGVTSSHNAASTTAVLISALAIGCFFFLVSLVIVGKRLFDGWKKRHYSRIERDYLIDGMYHE